MGKRLTTEEFIEKARDIHGDKYDYSSVDYVGTRFKINLICSKHGKFEIKANNHITGQGCKQCGHIKKSIKRSLTIREFISKAVTVHGDKYDYSKVIYINNTIKVIIGCPEHGEFEQSPDSHMNQKSDCPKCRYLNSAKKNMIPKTHLIKKFKNKHGERYDYTKMDFKGTKEKINIICPDHGEFKQLPTNHYKGAGCPTCRESRGEREIKLWFKSRSMNYTQQHKFKGCKDKSYLPFDFYLPEYNMCIEYQGEQHYRVVEFFGGKNGYEDRLRRDKIKRLYCQNNNITLLEIKYNDNIVEKLINTLERTK